MASHGNLMATIKGEFQIPAYLGRPDEAHMSDLRKGPPIRRSCQAETAWRRRVAGASPFSDWSGTMPLFIAQMAAWVRLLTSILRSRVFRWTLTVASVMPSRIAIILLLAPVTSAWRISCSRGDRPRTEFCGPAAFMLSSMEARLVGNTFSPLNHPL